MTYQQSVFKHYHSDRHFSQFYLQDGGKKPTGIDMEQNYVTVTLHIRRHLYAEHKMRPIRTDVAWSVSVRGGAREVLPPGANVCVAAPANQIGNRYSYGYNDDVGVECHEHYAKLGGVIT